MALTEVAHDLLQMSPEAVLALMAGVEYVCADLLSLVGNYVTNLQRRAIELADVRTVVRAASPVCLPPTSLWRRTHLHRRVLPRTDEDGSTDPRLLWPVPIQLCRLLAPRAAAAGPARSGRAAQGAPRCCARPCEARSGVANERRAPHPHQLFNASYQLLRENGHPTLFAKLEKLSDEYFRQVNVILTRTTTVEGWSFAFLANIVRSRSRR